IRNHMPLDFYFYIGVYNAAFNRVIPGRYVALDFARFGVLFFKDIKTDLFCPLTAETSLFNKNPHLHLLYLIIHFYLIKKFYKYMICVNEQQNTITAMEFGSNLIIIKMSTSFCV